MPISQPPRLARKVVTSSSSVKTPVRRQGGDFLRDDIFGPISLGEDSKFLMYMDGDFEGFFFVEN